MGSTRDDGEKLPVGGLNSLQLLIVLWARPFAIASRRIAKAREERIDFMAVTGGETPDFRTIAKFRTRHLPALRMLFIQDLRLWPAVAVGKRMNLHQPVVKTRRRSQRSVSLMFGPASHPGRGGARRR